MILFHVSVIIRNPKLFRSCSVMHDSHIRRIEKFFRCIGSTQEY